MRNSTLLKFSGAALLVSVLSFQAYAQDDITPITVAATTPEQNTTVMPVQMNMIIVDLNEPIYFQAVSGEEKSAIFYEGVTLVRQEDNTAIHPVDYTVVRNSGLRAYPGNDAIIDNSVRNRIALMFGTLTPGTYILDFKERSFEIGEGFSYKFNAAFTVGPWKVEESSVALNPFTEGYVVNPKDGSVVFSLKTFHVAYNPMYVEGAFLGEVAENPAITLTDGSNQLGGPATVATDADGRGFTVTFAEEVTALGTYTLNIPEGLYTSKEGDYKSPAVTATYEIKGSPYTEFTINPADGSDVEVPSYGRLAFTVTYTQTLGARNDAVYGWKDVTLSDGENVYTASQGSKLNGGLSYQAIFDNVSMLPSGTYTLNVPGGFYLSEDGLPTPPITAVYNITNPAVGVPGIEAENGTADVYDLAGRRVLRGADAEAVRSLDNGLYIINGKKVIVRK